MKPKLQYGSQGNSVSEAQARLNLLMPNASPPLAVDGKFGSKTTARVKQFQRNRGLVADGIVGAKTWAALDGTTPPKPGVAPRPKSPSRTGQRVSLGATLVCSCGSKTSRLKFFGTDRTVATILDSAPFCNVGPFGMCHSPHNPFVYLQTQAHQGVFTPQHCQPAVRGLWTPGTPVELVGTPPVAALDMNSVLVCVCGGVVSIVDKGK
jgi:hypothetical protein